MALKGNHTLWAWGANAAGQVGNGNNISAVAPVQIALPAPFVNNDWLAAAAGQHHTVALKSNFTLREWGNNTFGQLGDGTTLNSTFPVQEAGNAADWAAAATGDTHTLGRKSDGAIWAWGGNLNGQLGIGSNIDSPAPVKVGADTDWTDVAAGGAHSVALKTNGTIWSWGGNAFGQLGDGTNIFRNAPVLVAQARFLPKGDLNQNVAVDLADALKALRIAVLLDQPTPDDMITGDVAPLVNGVSIPDGFIDIADALLILRRVVGLIIL
jgi:alpha-tubulin suppressor-like RCC1 family protein